MKPKPEGKKWINKLKHRSLKPEGLCTRRNRSSSVALWCLASLSGSGEGAWSGRGRGQAGPASLTTFCFLFLSKHAPPPSSDPPWKHDDTGTDVPQELQFSGRGGGVVGGGRGRSPATTSCVPGHPVCALQGQGLGFVRGGGAWRAAEGGAVGGRGVTGGVGVLVGGGEKSGSYDDGL